MVTAGPSLRSLARSRRASRLLPPGPPTLSTLSPSPLRQGPKLPPTRFPDSSNTPPNAAAVEVFQLSPQLFPLSCRRSYVARPTLPLKSERWSCRRKKTKGRGARSRALLARPLFSIQTSSSSRLCRVQEKKWRQRHGGGGGREWSVQGLVCV